MKAQDTVMLIKRYEKCEKCENDKVGKSEGKLIVEDKTFYRSCKCGWSVKVSIEEGADE